MSYIGNTIQNQNYVPVINYFNGDGSTTAFTLSRPVASVDQVQVVISNVPQNPGTAFTVLNSTITFTSAPPAGTGNIYVYFTSPNTSVATVSQAPNISGPMTVTVGTATPIAGATNPVVAMAGAANNYVQSYIVNNTNGANSSADFTAYPSNGADAAGWVDMGITGPSYSQAAYSVTGANEAYLFGSGPTGTTGTGNLVIATDSTGTQNRIQFYTGGFSQAKSAAKMVIDGSGNVLVNTPTQFLSGKFCVSGASAFKGATDQNVVISGAVALSNAVTFAAVNDAYNANIPMEFRYATTTAWFNGGTEVARLQAADFLVGTTSYSSTVDGTIISRSGIAQTSGGGFNFVANKPASPAQSAWATFFVNGGLQGYINYTNPGCSYVNASDARLKTNIIDSPSALPILEQLRVRSFDWLEGDIHADFQWVAQEVHEVFPAGAAEGKDKENGEIEIPWGVDPSKMVGLCVKAIQEVNERLTQLEGVVVTQQTEINELKAEVAALKGGK